MSNYLPIQTAATNVPLSKALLEGMWLLKCVENTNEAAAYMLSTFSAGKIKVMTSDQMILYEALVGILPCKHEEQSAHR